MSKLLQTCIALCTVTCLVPTLDAANDQPAAQIQSNEPRVKSKFFSAEAIHILPKYQYLNNSDPGFNKILFTFENFPKNKEIIFEMKRLASKNKDAYQPIITFSIQDDGSYLVNTQPPQKLNAFIASAKGFLPGEKVTYRFHTADGSVNREITGIPAALTYRDDKGKVALRVELLTVEPTAYVIDFPTMQEGEEYEVKSTSVGEIATAKPRFSKNKPFHYSPSTGNGKAAGGEAILEIKRKNGEAYYIKLPWGTAFESYLKGKKAHLYH